MTLANVLTGNSGDNTMNGGSGADRMSGGLGNDLYIVDDEGDIAEESATQGTDTVQASVTFTLGAHIENLTLTGTSAINGTGNTMNNILTGNSGDNILAGDAGNDELIGGAGNDTLSGGAGDDIFRFDLGDGQDIIDADNDIPGTDTLAFGPGIAVSDLQFSSSGAGDLIIEVGNTGDQVKLTNWCSYHDANYAQNISAADYRLDLFTFNDGTVLTKYQLLDQRTVYGTEGDDVLWRFDEDSAWLDGGAGNDTLSGTYGADLLTGGKGNDTLSGSAGNDTFRFNLGDGQDTIDVGYNGIKTLAFGPGIAPSDLQFSLSDSQDLVIEVGDTGDQVKLLRQSERMDLFSFADNGTILTFSQLLALGAVHGTAGNDIFSGTGTDNDWFDGGAGDDTLYGNSGNDILAGGTGNDVLAGGVGDDVFQFNLGDGQETIRTDASFGINSSSTGIDTLAFGTGITLSALQFLKVDYDLVMKVGTAGDQVTLADWYSNKVSTEYRVDRFSFGDGTVLSRDQLLVGRTVYVYGTAGDDTLSGGEADDRLEGGAGNDSLLGNGGNNEIIGGLGNDTIYGGDGNNILRFNLGDGQDTYWAPYSSAGVDTLAFGQGITASNLRFFERGEDNLVILVGESGDWVELGGWSNARSHYNLQSFTFTDATVLTLDEVLAKQPVRGTAGNDILSGTAANDWFNGSAGNDTISGNEGNDILQGGDGNDTLHGGVGNDELLGGYGDDTFRFGLGDGEDTIWYDEMYGTDTLAFGSGITLSDLQFFKVGYDLVVKVDDAGEQVKLNRWYDPWSSFSGRLDLFSFADGTILTCDQLTEQKMVHGSDENDAMSGAGSVRDWFEGNGGDDTLIGNDGNDILAGGVGNDSLSGGAGDDIFQFNLGDGQDTILSDAVVGSDTLAFGPGISLSDLQLVKGAHDLIIKVGNTGDQVKLVDWCNTLSTGYRLNRFSFADGSIVLTRDDLLVQGTVHGTTGADTFSGIDTENDWFDGGTGDDIIYGNDGNDILTGGAGNDSLQGGAGDDIFRFNLGDGQDRIWNLYPPGGIGIDTLAFGSGISLADLQFSYIGGYDLVVKVGDSGDQIVLDDWYSPYGEYRTSLERFSFADGTILTRNELWAQKPVYGTAGNDTLTGLWRNRKPEDNDWFIGGTGNDILSGGYGNDILEGGAGNDTLAGASGSDIYRFNLGDGQDTIYWDYASNHSSSPVSNSDTLSFGADITLDDLQFFAPATAASSFLDLVIKIGDDGDQVVLADWFGQDPSYGWGAIYQINRFSFADGTVLDRNHLFFEKTVYGSDGDNKLWDDGGGNNWFDGQGGNDEFRSYAGADILKGGAGNDTFFSGSGNDISIGDSGNDVYWFYRGDGQDSVDDLDLVSGADVLRFGTGIADTDIYALKTANDLVLKIKNTNDRISFIDYYTADITDGDKTFDHKVNKFEFTNGVVWDQNMIQAAVDSLASLNHAPTVNNSLAALQACTDNLFTYSVPLATITDPDPWDSITYSVTMQDGSPLPAWLTFDPTTRTLSGTPGANDVGSLQFVLRGTDNYNLSAEEVVTLNVVPPNRAPVLSTAIPDTKAELDEGFNFTIAAATFTDPDVGDVLSYSATLADGSVLPSWLNFDKATRTFSGTPSALGTISVCVNATDTGNLTTSDIFDLTVSVHDLNLNGTAGADTLTGKAGNDTLSGLAGNDTLNGKAGADFLDGGTGSDTMLGGLGDDIYVVDIASDVVTENANEGTDTVRSNITYTLGTNVENLTLIGAAAINGIGNSRSNVLIGNSAANTLNGGTGADSLSGSLGNDIYIVDNAGDIVTENLGEGTDTVQSGVTYTLSDYVENLTLTGSAAINATGNAFDNILTGNSGVNTLTGGAGNDTLKGGAGADKMFGGLDNDIYVVDVATDVITENAGEGIDSVQSSVTYTLAANVENLTLTGSSAINGTGNSLDNTLIGNGKANTLKGDAGNDLLDGGAGADKMFGGTGDDTYVVNTSTDVVTEYAGEGFDTVLSTVTWTLGANLENLTLTGTSATKGTGNTLNNNLFGNNAVNTLSGGAGNDRLDGGLGNDTLTGGAGNDFFVFDTVLNATANKDKISDFASGFDKIELDKSIFTSLGEEGTLLSANFRASTTGAAGDENDYILYNTSSGALLYDADGNGQGVAIEFATLTNKPAIKAEDFMIVS